MYICGKVALALEGQWLIMSEKYRSGRSCSDIFYALFCLLIYYSLTGGESAVSRRETAWKNPECAAWKNPD